MIVANNPALTTWLSVPKNSDFPIQNIPFGIVEIMVLDMQLQELEIP